jgi:hypothetical protein
MLPCNQKLSRQSLTTHRDTITVKTQGTCYHMQFLDAFRESQWWLPAVSRLDSSSHLGADGSKPFQAMWPTLDPSSLVIHHLQLLILPRIVVLLTHPHRLAIVVYKVSNFVVLAGLITWVFSPRQNRCALPLLTCQSGGLLCRIFRSQQAALKAGASLP